MGWANASFRVELFGSPAADPSGHGQGKTFLRALTVTTDASGNASFTLIAAAQPQGSVVAATATDQATGDTSPFSVSQAVPADSGGTIDLTLTAAGSGAGTRATVRVYDASGSLFSTFQPFGAFTGGARV